MGGLGLCGSGSEGRGRLHVFDRGLVLNRTAGRWGLKLKVWACYNQFGKLEMYKSELFILVGVRARSNCLQILNEATKEKSWD